MDTTYTEYLHQEHSIKAQIKDKLFTVNEIDFNNTITCERRDFRNRKAPDRPLYRIAEVVFGQSPEWFMFGGINSNSDKPFDDSSTITATAAVGKRIYAEGNHSLYLAFFYSREKVMPFKYNTPFPFFAYTWRSENLTISIGVPTMIIWKITPKLMFMGSYYPVQNIDMSLTFRPLPFISIASESQWKVEGYYLSDRAVKNHKLYHEYLLSRIKLQGYVARHAGVFISGGYRLSDKYFTAHESSDRAHTVTCPRSYLFEGGVQALF
jgi:hypothetical protein